MTDNPEKKSFSLHKKDFDFVVSTDSIPRKVSEVIRDAAIEKLEDITRLRQYGMVERLKDQGATRYFFYPFSDLGDARDVGEGADFVYDDADATESEESVYKYGKGFQLTWEANHLSKLPIRAAQSKQAVSKVIKKEDNVISTRLIADTGSTYANTAGAWSSSTADPVQNIRRAKRLIKNKGYDADMILLNPTNAEELTTVVSQNLWNGLTEKTVTSGVVPFFMGLKVVECSEVTENTAIVMKSGSSGAFQLGEAMPVSINMFDDNDKQTTKVQAFERVAVAVVRPDAVCTITSI